MKKYFVLALIFISSMGALIYRSGPSDSNGQRESFAAKKNPQAAPADAIQGSPSTLPKAAALHAPTAVRDLPLEAIQSQVDFDKALDAADLTQTITISQITQKLRKLEPKAQAAFFMTSLVELGQKDPDRRERLVFIANEVQGDALLPFWKDLVLRKIPKYDDETRFLNFGEPTEEMQSIHLELLNSIRNIGVIAGHDPAAVKVLFDLVSQPSSPLHDDFVRERAYISLKEADLSAALRSLKGLEENDSLRPRLMAP